MRSTMVSKRRMSMAAFLTLAAIVITQSARSATTGGVAAQAVSGGEGCIRRNAIQVSNSCSSQIEVVYNIATSCRGVERFGLEYNVAVHVWGGQSAWPVACRVCEWIGSQSQGLNCSGFVAATDPVRSQDLPISLVVNDPGLATPSNEVTVDCLVDPGAAIHSMDVTAIDFCDGFLQTGFCSVCNAGYM
jgi:hypothetical protein